MKQAYIHTLIYIWHLLEDVGLIIQRQHYFHRKQTELTSVGFTHSATNYFKLKIGKPAQKLKFSQLNP